MFPDSVVDVVRDQLAIRLVDFAIETFDPVTETMQPLEPTFLDRPLRAEDPNRSISIYAYDWVPDEATQEMGSGLAFAGPTVTRYNYRIQSLTRYVVEEEQRADASVDAKVIRAILARDPGLRVALEALSDEVAGVREKYLRYGVSRQRFFNNELRGTFLGLCLTEFWVDTQTTSPA